MHIPTPAVLVAAVAIATLAAPAPSQAQSPTSAATKRPGQVVMTGRPPTRVTVRKRSYLDPGTETKAGGEHYQDYAYPAGGNSPMLNSTLFNSGPGLPFTNNRMPFPNCFDLGGFCR
jgi:hypothetical protein